MYFKKATIFIVLLACVALSECRRKTVKAKKIRRGNCHNVVAPPCGCQNSLLDIITCGCQGPIIENALRALAPLEIGFPACQNPIIEIPYKYPEPIEFNPLGCLFSSIEIPNYGVLPAPITVPNLEYYAAVDLPCGCPGPKCGCHSPALTIPAYEEYVAAIEVPTCGCQGTKIPSVPTYSYGSPVIEIPSYTTAPIIQAPCGCRGSVASPCSCQGSCACSGIPNSPCGCQEPCSYAEYQIISCGCQGSCACPGIPTTCECPGPCGCGVIPMPCGCQGTCGCPNIQPTVGFVPTVEVPSCGCQGTCACQRQGGLLPALDVPPCGCGCGIPGCNCPQYLRQVTLQPPFL